LIVSEGVILRIFLYLLDLPIRSPLFWALLTISSIARDIKGFPLGHVEAPANVNETLMVEPLLDGLLGDDLEVELLAGDSGLSPAVSSKPSTPRRWKASSRGGG